MKNDGNNILPRAEMFKRMLELTVRPVIKAGSYESIPEFGPLGTNYLDGVLELANTDIVTKRMALDVKAQFAASLYLIAKVKEVHDDKIVCDAGSDGFKSETATKYYYSMLNRALSWMHANINSELLFVAFVIMVRVLEMEVMVGLIDNEDIRKFTVLEVEDDDEFGDAILPIGEYLQASYDAGDLEWIFGDKAKPSANANADSYAAVSDTGDDSDTEVPVPGTGHASADALIIDISGLNTADRANLRADLNAMLQDYGIGSDTGAIINPQA